MFQSDCTKSKVYIIIILHHDYTYDKMAIT